MYEKNYLKINKYVPHESKYIKIKSLLTIISHEIRKHKKSKMIYNLWVRKQITKYDKVNIKFIERQKSTQFYILIISLNYREVKREVKRLLIRNIFKKM